jgi:hypothetical protein
MGNSRKFLLGFKTLCFLLLGFTSFAQTVGDYRSNNASGTWSNRLHWQRWTGSSWGTPASSPTSSNGVITIRNGHTMNVTASVTVDQVVVDGGCTININSGVTLTVADGTGTDLANQGDIIVGGTLAVTSPAVVQIQSNSNGDGQISSVTGTITGNITVERFLPNTIGSRAFRYLASPFTNETVASWMNSFPITGTFTDPSNPLLWPGLSGINQASPSLYFYDQSVPGYATYPENGQSSSRPLVNGRGYAAYVRQTESITLSFNGSVRTGSLPVTLTSNGTGYNLIGNPYPSAIKWDNVNLSGVAINGEISMLDNTDNSGIGAGVFSYYLQGSPGLAIPGGWDGTIAMGQAFWVKATASTTLTFSETNKIVNGSPGFFRKETQSAENVLRCQITGVGVTNTRKDQLVISFRDDALDAKDRYDVEKRDNALLNFSSFSSNGVDLAINTLGKLSSSREISLNLRGIVTGDYKMDFSQLESFDPSVIIELVDDYTKKTVTIDAQNSSYNFSVTTDLLSSGSRRFRVNIKNLVTGIEDERVQVNGYPNPVSNQYTISLSKNVYFLGKVVFYNSVGQLVEPILVNSTQSQNVFDFSNFPSGVFIVKIPTTSGFHLLKAIKK